MRDDYQRPGERGDEQPRAPRLTWYISIIAIVWLASVVNGVWLLLG